jgi:predicted phosphodiesterase
MEKRHISVFISLVFIIGTICYVTFAKTNIQLTDTKQVGLDFSFIQISDIHWGDPENNRRAASIIAKINASDISPEFILITGDIMNNYTDSITTRAAYIALCSLKYPLIFIPGNHDILYYPEPESRNRFQQIFGPLDTTFIHKGVRFVCFNSNWMNERANPSSDSILFKVGSTIGKDTLPKILVAHIPPVENYYNGMAHTGWLPEYYHVFDSLVNTPSGNVRAILAGHFHRNEMHWIGAIPLYVCGPVAHNLGRQARYRLYFWKNGRLGYHTVHLDEK